MSEHGPTINSRVVAIALFRVWRRDRKEDRMQTPMTHSECAESQTADECFVSKTKAARPRKVINSFRGGDKRGKKNSAMLADRKGNFDADFFCALRVKKHFTIAINYDGSQSRRA